MAFSIKEAFAEWELEFSHMMLVCPEKAPGFRTAQKTGFFGSTGQQLFFQSRATI
ncbi:hypothetical protein A4U53_040875 (plasmid) [Rhizobium ruizarguesonis]|uniref:Uncharacterized protein n=1 Tax=Rhizobium ruizarguesonis TaxID=2081791 RepID=A0ACD5EXM1_9HYPH